MVEMFFHHLQGILHFLFAGSLHSHTETVFEPALQFVRGANVAQYSMNQQSDPIAELLGLA
jgi:hypothetical protein